MSLKAIVARLALAVVMPIGLVTAALYPISVYHLSAQAEARRDSAQTILEAGHEALNNALNESLNHVLAAADTPALPRFLNARHSLGSPIQRASTQIVREQLEALLATLLEHYGRYSEIAVYDLEGAPLIRVAEGELSRALEDIAGTERFLEGGSGNAGDIYVSAPYQEVSGGPPVVDIVTSVFSERGERKGLLLFRLDWADLTSGLEHVLSIDEDVRSLLVDTNGRWLLPSADGRPDFSVDIREAYPGVWEGITQRGRGSVTLEHILVQFASHDIRSDQYQSRAGMITSPTGAHPWRLGVVASKPTLGELLQENQAATLFALLVYLVAGGFGVYWVLSHDRQRQLRRQAQVHAREARSFAWEVRDLYEHAPCGYHSLDEAGRVVKMNRTELSWLGYSPAEVLGTANYRDFLAPGSLAAFEEAFSAVQGPAEEGSAELELVTRDGKLLPVVIQATAYTDDDGFVHSRAMVFDLTERKEMEAYLERQALTDPLTGLGNRRFLEEQAVMEIAGADRRQEPVSLIAVDLDNFKRINDTYGHDVGDEVLKAFAGIATEVLRDGDVLARIGGEEFAVLLPATGTEQAITVAERLREAIQKSPAKVDPTAVRGGELTYTASLGVSEVHPGEASLKPAIKRADKGLYDAKDQGRNQVQVGA